MILADLSLGQSYPLNSDLRISRGEGLDRYRFHNVSFASRSLDEPLWYSLRLAVTSRGRLSPAVGIELIHAKIFARTWEPVRMTGIHGGSVVDTTRPLEMIVQRFDISHGINLLAVEILLERGLVGSPPGSAGPSVSLYGGLGAGPVIAHPENRIDGKVNRQAYQVAGLGGVGFAGIRAHPVRRAGLLVEYKVTASSPEVAVASGTARFKERTHHLAVGLTIRLAPS